MGKMDKSGFESLAKESQLYPQESLLKVKKNKGTFFIGMPKEISLQEKRITLTPDAVGLLSGEGHDVWVETGAGLGSNFTDHQYSEAGAKVVYSAKEVYQADAILKIEPPTIEEIAFLKAGQILISAFQYGNQTATYLEALCRKKVIALGFELIEDKVGGMPIIRAMSEIAGSTVMQVAAEHLSTAHNGKGVILGGVTGVPPTKVVIIGAGTVAEHAARAAQGLGADVKIFDNHIYKLRRIKHALGQQVYTSTIDTATLRNCLVTADVVIGALRSEKGRNRHVVSEEMVSMMKPKSVIIDLTIDQGGCVATSRLTTLNKPTFIKHEVVHYCVPNITSRVACTATIALSNIFTPTILRAGEEGGIENMIFTHHWFMKGVYAYKGCITNKYIADKFHLKHKDLDLIMATRF